MSSTIGSKDGVAASHSAEAERAVLGAVLLNPENFFALTEQSQLKPDHFYLPNHQIIYTAVSSLADRGEVISVLGVEEEISTVDKDYADELRRTAYLVDLVEACPVAENITYYANIIRKRAGVRKVVNLCTETIQKVAEGGGSLVDHIGDLEREFGQIIDENEVDRQKVTAREILAPTLKAIEKRIGNKGGITGISSGFRDLDYFTGGWQSSDLIILAARPGMGKTALILNWVLNAVMQTEKVVAVFTLEMSREQLMERLLSAQGKVDSVKLRKGDLTEEDQDRVLFGARSIHKNGMRLLIDETSSISLTELRAKCRRFRREFGLDMVVIDYLQLMMGSAVARKQGREREISEISNGLKALAKELAIPVIACAQLNRTPDARPDKRPRISDLRESGSMEQDADQIMFIYRDDYYNPDSEHAGKAEVLIAKNRHGEVGTAMLAWIPNYVSFHNLVVDE